MVDFYAAFFSLPLSMWIGYLGHKGCGLLLLFFYFFFTCRTFFLHGAGFFHVMYSTSTYLADCTIPDTISIYSEENKICAI